MNGCIQKIITIPAALQGVSNPVIRVVHPDWLLKRLAERNSSSKQRKIDDIFSVKPRQLISAEINNTDDNSVLDIEDITGKTNKNRPTLVNKINLPQEPVNLTNTKSNATKRKHDQLNEIVPKCNWREVLGNPPKFSSIPKEFKIWHTFHKRKWILQMEFKRSGKKNDGSNNNNNTVFSATTGRSLTDFVMKSATTKAQKPWQILRISETNSTGIYKLWMLADTELFSISLKMMRVFYVNQLKPLEKESSLCRKASKHLPRSQISYNLYEYSIPESVFYKHKNEIMNEFSNSNVEGIYELNVPLMFSFLMRLGCVCSLKKTSKFKVYLHFSFFYYSTL